MSPISEQLTASLSNSIIDQHNINLPTPLQIPFKFTYLTDPIVTMLYVQFHFQNHFASRISRHLKC